MEKVKSVTVRCCVAIYTHSKFHPEHVVIAIVVIGKETIVAFIVEVIKAVTLGR